jgi:type IV pilus assembly protein PilM
MAKIASTSPRLDKGRKRRDRRPGRFWRARQNITALDVDGEMLRVVQTVQRGGRLRVTRFAARQLDLPAGQNASDPAVMGAGIAKALQGLNLKPGPVVMGVPRALAVLRTLSMPAAAGESELASMIHFQISKDLPFPVGEAVIDFKVQWPHAGGSAEPRPDKPSPLASETGKAEADAGRVDVLVAAVRRGVVESYQAIARAAGLKLAALGLRSYANARCVQACNLIRGHDYVALVSLRLDEVIIDVLDEQDLVFSRGSSVTQPEHAGAEGDSEAGPSPGRAGPEGTPEPGPLEIGTATAADREGDFAGAVTIEVVRSLHGFEGAAHHGLVAKVVVAGGTGHEQAVVESLQKRLSIPCSLLDPASALGLPESERAHSPGALAAFGLGLGATDPEGLPFDFLNPKRPAVPGANRRLKQMAAAAAALIVLFGFLGVRHRLVGGRLAAQNRLAEEVARERKKAPVYKQTLLQAKSVAEWEKARHKWLDHFAYLSSVLPTSQDIYLNSFAVSGRGTIRLGVQARAGEVIANLDKALRAAGYEVNPLAINPSPDKYGYPFKSNVEIDLPPGLKIDFPPGALARQKERTPAGPSSSTNGPARKASGSTPNPAARK